MNPTVLAEGLKTSVATATSPFPHTPMPLLIGGIDAQAILTWMGTAGGSAIIIYILTQVFAIWKGRGEKVQTRNASLIEQRDTAIEERDAEYRRRQCADARAACEARNARRLWDYAARLRRQMFVAGIEPEAQEPELEVCDTYVAREAAIGTDDEPPRKGRRRA